MSLPCAEAGAGQAEERTEEAPVDGRWRSMRSALPALACVVIFTACPREKPPEPKPAAAALVGQRSGQVTLLVTGHEVGHLPERAARLLAEWKAKEGWPDALAFSTGDSFAGAALSSHFLGVPTAEVMKALQYKASALGNHDLDLGVDALSAFGQASGLTLLAANLKQKPGAVQPLKVAPSMVVTKEGLRVGVVGFAGPKTLATAYGRASGLELVPLSESVGAALESLKKDSPDLVVALIDDCFVPLQKVLATRADWKVDLVVGTRCEGTEEYVSGPTQFFSAGDELSHYVSAKFQLAPDGTKKLTASRKALAALGPGDRDLEMLKERWQKQLEVQLGQRIGFTRSGFAQDARELRTWVATALKDATKADAALINKKGIRAALPKGPVTRASVYSLIPFDNAVVTLKVKGEVIARLKTHPEAFIVSPAKLEAAKEYLLATTDYLYFGGDDLGLEAVAPELELTGQVWQTPVISWLEKQGSSEKKPLEKLLK